MLLILFLLSLLIFSFWVFYWIWNILHKMQFIQNQPRESTLALCQKLSFYCINQWQKIVATIKKPTCLCLCRGKKNKSSPCNASFWCFKNTRISNFRMNNEYFVSVMKKNGKTCCLLMSLHSVRTNCNKSLFGV